MVDWDDYFMTMVYLVAMKSKDEQTHMGAIVVGPDREIRSTGYNSFVRGIKDDIPTRQERPEKYFWFEHAERNAIYNSSLIGVSLKDCTLYTNGVPCADCGRAVVQAGIKYVVVDKNWSNGDTWDESAKRTLVLFDEADIWLRYWEGEIVTDIHKFQRGENF